MLNCLVLFFERVFLGKCSPLKLSLIESTLSRTSSILSLVVVSSYQSYEWSAMTCIDSRACVGVIRGMKPLKLRILWVDMSNPVRRYEPSVDSSDRATDIGKEDHCIFPKHDTMSRLSLA
ncbi:hypothetical protein Tco_0836507 [Tanacetum coccineum]